MPWFFDDDKNSNSLSFNDNDEDELEPTITYFVEKDNFTNEDYNMVLDAIYKDIENE